MNKIYKKVSVWNNHAHVTWAIRESHWISAETYYKTTENKKTQPVGSKNDSFNQSGNFTGCKLLVGSYILMLLLVIVQRKYENVVKDKCISKYFA